MKDKSDYKDIIKLHKAWADRYMLLWYLFVVTLFAGISFLLDESSLEAAVKTASYATRRRRPSRRTKPVKPTS